MGTVNDYEAHILAKTYTFCLPWLNVPISKDGLDHGKYEPDHNEGVNERFMTLAQLIDATNILVKYKANDLVP